MTFLPFPIHSLLLLRWPGHTYSHCRRLPEITLSGCAPYARSAAVTDSQSWSNMGLHWVWSTLLAKMHTQLFLLKVAYFCSYAPTKTPLCCAKHGTVVVETRSSKEQSHRNWAEQMWVAQVITNSCLQGKFFLPWDSTQAQLGTFSKGFSNVKQFLNYRAKANMFIWYFAYFKAFCPPLLLIWKLVLSEDSFRMNY